MFVPVYIALYCRCGAHHHRCCARHWHASHRCAHVVRRRLAARLLRDQPVRAVDVQFGHRRLDLRGRRLRWLCGQVDWQGRRRAGLRRPDCVVAAGHFMRDSASRHHFGWCVSLFRVFVWCVRASTETVAADTTKRFSCDQTDATALAAVAVGAPWLKRVGTPKFDVNIYVDGVSAAHTSPPKSRLCWRRSNNWAATVGPTWRRTSPRRCFWSLASGKWRSSAATRSRRASSPPTVRRCAVYCPVC